MLLDTTHSPLVESVEYGISFPADFEFTYAIILVEQKLVATFIDGWSSGLDFVGKVYDFEGKKVAEIPHPPAGVGGRPSAFWYAAETKDGVWIGFHQQSERDFGGIFNFRSMKFISYNEAR